MHEHFTQQELKDIDEASMKIVLGGIDYYTTLPIGMVCSNPATPW